MTNRRSIRAQRARTSSQADGGFTDTFTRVRRSIVRVDCPGAGGSGFFLDRPKSIVTCSHVVSGEKEVRVVLDGGTTIPARVIYDNPHLDLVFLTTERASRSPGLVFLEARAKRIGLKVALVGYPDGKGPTIADGVISAIRSDAGAAQQLQTTVPMNPGVSGSPVVSREGRLVNMAASGRIDLQATNFALDVDVIRQEAGKIRAAMKPGRELHACRACGQTFSGDMDFCTNCGATTQEDDEGFDAAPEEGGLTKAEVKKAVATIVTALADFKLVLHPDRDDEFQSIYWQFRSNRSQVFVIFSPAVEDGLIQVRSLCAMTPRANHLPFYRKLLEMNAKDLPGCAFGVVDDYVVLATARSAKRLKKAHVKEMISDVADASGAIGGFLIEEFGCRPVG